MEGVMGGNNVGPNSIDKSEVLDVKPVRTLVPIFPDPSEGPPFVGVPPNGPFPFGFSSFFPFNGSNPNQNVTSPTAAPIRPNQNVTNPTAAPIRPVTTKRTKGQSIPPMDAHGNHGQKPAGADPPVKKRGRGRPRTRFP